MPSLPVNRGAKRAREARADLGLPEQGPLDCVLETVEDLGGLPVFVMEMPADIAGAFWSKGEAAFAFVNGTQATVRQRFTVAHEFGHRRCGHAGTLDSVANLQGRTTDEREIEANAFAAELLMPKAGVAPWLEGREPGLDEVVRYAAEHGVSAIAALHRFTTAGAIAAPGAKRLRQEIEDDLHLELARHLGLEDRRDALARAPLPRVPPGVSGDASALGAVLLGAATPAAAARAAGVEPDRLAGALESYGF